jgi:glutamate-1-semialdehyde 2,1-aminomutase
MTSRYENSELLLKRALARIPGGTQTFSKSYTQYPFGVSPYFASRGKGARIWDVDGNEYLDFVSALLAVNLGYGDPDVTERVLAQVSEGVTLSLPMTIEVELAERISEIVPCADMVRFAKNGSDATSAAVRAARAFTGRDLIAVCGYHGWQDWYIGSTTRDLGVPQAVKALTLKFAYNDLSSLESVFSQHPNSIAAVIMEPANAVAPAEGFLKGVKAMAQANGALLIFDEIIAGFRFAEGGGQQLFGVEPDLCALGKGLANGYPLAAVAGRTDVMKVMESVFFSVTQGSEALSIAAACATLDKIRDEPVIQKLWDLGRELQSGVAQLIDSHGVGAFVSQAGLPPWSFLNFADHNGISSWHTKTLWMQECLARGILCLGTHNLNYAHSRQDIERLLTVYDEVFPLLRSAVVEGGMESLLRCAPLEPLFKVR